jgi:hypothetical protein
LNSTKLRVFAVAPVVGSTVVGAVTHQERRSAKRGSEGEQAENMTIARGGFHGIEFRCSLRVAAFHANARQKPGGKTEAQPYEARSLTDLGRASQSWYFR